jgi:hypothetical protein
VALRIDTDAFRASLPSEVLRAASELRRSGAVSAIELADGGIQAVVREGDDTYLPWVGVAGHDFTGECDCEAGDGLCAHAVALALTGFEQGVVWSGIATPPSAAVVSAEHARFAQAVARLAPRQVADLIVTHAAQDRLFAATLLRMAGLLEPCGESALQDFRLALREVSNATTGRWQISDVETAGQRLAAEAEILCAHPASEAALELVEKALLVWDELSGHLHDGYYDRRIDPEEVGYPLTEAHRTLCERLGLNPGEVAERVTALVGRCNYDTLDVEAYSELLSDEDFEALSRSTRS